MNSKGKALEKAKKSYSGKEDMANELSEFKKQAKSRIAQGLSPLPVNK